MKRIPATLGYEIIVDDEDYELLSQFRWYAHNCAGAGKPGSKRPARRTSVAEGRKVIALINYILPKREGFARDHINGDPWDNRRINLRYCTNAENARNRRKHGRTCSNPYKGVYATGGGWLARICHDHVIFDLGSHATPEDAATAYDRAALFLHGEFARLNFPDRNTAPASPEAMRAGRVLRAERVRAEAASRVASGETCSAVAASIGVSCSTVSKWSHSLGVAPVRGRPTLERQAA